MEESLKFKFIQTPRLHPISDFVSDTITAREEIG